MFTNCTISNMFNTPSSLISEIKNWLVVGVWLPKIKLINKTGKNLSKIINIGIRLNPDIDGNTHGKITTGKKTDKFG